MLVGQAELEKLCATRNTTTKSQLSGLDGGAVASSSPSLLKPSLHILYNLSRFCFLRHHPTTTKKFP